MPNTAEKVLQFPVELHLAKVRRALKKRRVVIVTAPTGSGKSSCIPDYLETLLAKDFEARGDYVIVAVPRRVLAWSLAIWVASRRGEEVGQSVGFQTGIEKCYSENTRIFFVTDGLQEIREFLNHTRRRAILIIDELHEWNIHQEMLLAEAKRAIRRQQLKGLVVMSATIRTDELSAYLGDAPVLEIPGSMFEVVEHPPNQGTVADLVERLLREGKKTLVFVPGKREISSLIGELKSRELNAVILPLHGKQTVDEQKRCFEDYDKPLCIVSTDIAQSGVTVPGVQAIVDTGRVRIWKVIDGIEGLYTAFISIDDYLQRKGRTGRTGPGEYFPCYDRRQLALDPTPEIQRLLLETTALRVKTFAGRDIEGMDLFHAPPAKEIRRAKRRLFALDCMTEGGEITEIGREVAFLPVSTQNGRMIVEGRQRGVLQDIISIAAIVEARGITDSGNAAWHLRYCPDEIESDVIAQLLVFKAAIAALKEATDQESLRKVEQELESYGVNLIALHSAIEKREKIATSVNGTEFVCPSTLYRNNLLAAIRKGFSGHFFVKTEGGWMNGDGDVRVLERSSILPDDVSCLVGIPWNLDLKKSEPGEDTLLLIRMATVVSKADLPRWLLSIHSEESKALHRAKSIAGKRRKDNGSRLPLKQRRH